MKSEAPLLGNHSQAPQPRGSVDEKLHHPRHPIIDVLTQFRPKLLSLQARFKDVSDPHLLTQQHKRQEFVRNHYAFLPNYVADVAPFDLTFFDMRSIWDMAKDIFEQYGRYAFAQMVTSTYITQSLDSEEGRAFCNNFFGKLEIPEAMRNEPTLAAMEHRLDFVGRQVAQLRTMLNDSPSIVDYSPSDRESTLYRRALDGMISENFGNGIQPLYFALYKVKR